MIDDYSQYLKQAYTLAEQAGEAILAVYASDDFEVSIKDDNTPLTKADVLANQVIVDGLKALTPDIPILSEEFTEVPYSERKMWNQYWLIDPLDGTKEFIDRTGEFTVNIALIDGDQAMLGVVYVPVLGEGYEACRGCGAFKRSKDGTYNFINARPRPENNVKVAISRRHGNSSAQLLEKLGSHELIHKGSALKICLVAEGEADIYPRFGPTSEWDTAAGQCILEEAGGRLMNFKGEELRYNQKASTLNPEFLAVGDSSHDWLQYL